MENKNLNEITLEVINNSTYSIMPNNNGIRFKMGPDKHEIISFKGLSDYIKNISREFRHITAKVEYNCGQEYYCIAICENVYIMKYNGKNLYFSYNQLDADSIINKVMHDISIQIKEILDDYNLYCDDNNKIECKLKFNPNGDRILHYYDHTVFDANDYFDILHAKIIDNTNNLLSELDEYQDRYVKKYGSKNKYIDKTISQLKDLKKIEVLTRW